MHALPRVVLALALVASLAPADDQADTILNAMQAAPSPYSVILPPDAKVGLWWEHTLPGSKTKLRYAITAERSGKLIVEQAQDVAGAPIVNAWLVDPEVDLNAEVADGEQLQHNVLEAWVGLRGQAPRAKKVMDAPRKQPAETVEGVELSERDEPLELAGKTWEAHVFVSEQSETWVVRGSQFVLKSVYQGKVVMELTAMGEDATSSLAWPSKK
ncbi:MAG: hypothetical protein KDD82_07980 [Planctomycetes bacterium]|nr:hypothetical protein [Planctomycetota bacterium]